MLTRFEPKEPFIDMPQEWIEEVNKLLSSVYQTQLKALNGHFEVLGRSYTKELILAVSFLHKENPTSIPVTYIASVDNPANQAEKLKALLDIMVDSVGVFFDHYFANQDSWDEYSSTWQEATFKKENVYYLITRENLGLMVAADKLLRESLN